jgi:hypothetical protein
MPDAFDDLSTAEKIGQTKQNGLKIASDWEEKPSGGTQPAVFSQWPECYYHMVASESTSSQAVVWVNAGQSPSASVDDIVAGQSPVLSVLQDNR